MRQASGCPQQTIAFPSKTTPESLADFVTTTIERGTQSSDFQMPPRTSARGSVTRDQASSPPKQSSERQSQSPVRRSTRSTRSQSVELGENENATATKRGGRRGVRHGSAESVESNASASSRGGRTRKATRAIAAAANRGEHGIFC